MGTARKAFLFKPGEYGSDAGANDPTTATDFIDSPVGFYESVAGLGDSPEDVTVNGNLRSAPSGGALTVFWRSLSNMTINPIEADETPHTLRWHTSQASPLRRMNITGNLHLNSPAGGFAFGSAVANSKISGTVDSGQARPNLPTDPGKGGQAALLHAQQRHRRVGWHSRKLRLLRR